jgi:hypothetical protein
MKALVARVKDLLLSPAAEWDVIDKEDTAPVALAVRYVAPLVVAPVVAMVVGLSVVGVRVGGDVHRAPLMWVSLSGLLFFALAIAAVFAFALLLDWLAPRFGAPRNYQRAFKVSAYSITAAMLAGVLTVAPALGVVALLGAAYSLYLLFVGAPKVMHAPAASAVNYSIVATFAAIAVALLVGLASMAAAGPTVSLLPELARLPDFGAARTAAAGVAPETATLAAAAGKLGAGAPGSVSGGDLRGAAPAAIAGLTRVSVGVERRGIAGARTVELDAEYRRGRRYIVLQIVYSGSIAETIGFGGPATSEFVRETADGYSRRRRAGEAIIAEEWNEASRTGSYARLAGDSFYVRASGGGGTKPADLRHAVELFGRETLAQFEAES